MRLARYLLLPLAALLAGAAPAPQLEIDSQAAERIRAHVEFLASDLLEGREVGSRGHRIAAGYVASEFRKLGLQPGGPNGSWFVEVPFRRATIAGAPRIALKLNGRTIPLTVGQDAAVRPSVTERERSLTAPLVFVGHGISDARLGIDDYAGLDVRGKIVVALSGPKAGLPSDVAAHLKSAQPATAAERGALGLIEIPDPGSESSVERYAKRPVVDWVDQAGRSSRSGGVRAFIALSPQTIERLFDKAPMRLAAVRAQVAAGKAVRGFDLPASLTLSASSTWEDFTSPNVVAVLRGSDPKLAREHVVLMGHLDHLGLKKDAKPGEDAIYNGALDNAVGIATMLEAARHFAETREAPRRSVMFLAVTGEEVGLLGADYFATHPVVPAADIVGLVNLDMPLLLYDFTDVVAFGAEHSTISRAVGEAGAGMRIALSPDPLPGEALFVRSDHYPFVKHGVPSTFLMTGYGNGGQQAWTRFLGDTYHKVTDDLSQPIRWRAGARFAELNYRIARTIADSDERPMWYGQDYFGDAFAPAQPKAKR
jgi:Zn-dependent M28 family amino/carboxypeptidase